MELISLFVNVVKKERDEFKLFNSNVCRQLEIIKGVVVVTVLIF